MYVIKKKFRRKKGIVTFYYLAENKVIDNKPRLKNVKYLGNADKIMKVYQFYEKNHK